MTRDAVADYLSAATTFVSLVDLAETLDARRLLGELAIALTDLYSAAARLPDPDITSDELLPRRELSRHTALEGVLRGDDVNWESIDWKYHDEWLGEPYERKRVVWLLAFRSAFTMNYDAAERLLGYVAPLAEGGVAALSDEERGYLEGLAPLE